MSLFENITKLFSSQQKKVPAGFFSFFNPTAMPRVNEKEFVRAYQGWVYACTNAIADRLGNIEIFMEQKKGKDWQKMDTHPAVELLHAPNDFTSATELFFLYEVYQQLNGNSFWYVDRNGKGNPAEIWQLDPTKVEIIRDKQSLVGGYVLNVDAANKIPLTPDEVIHIKRPNPSDPIRGIGTVQAAAIAIDTDTYASEWQRNFFSNAAMPSGILSKEGEMTQEQFDRLKVQWDAKYKGVTNAHKMAILDGGLKFQSITPTSREMEYTNSRKNTRDEVLAIFGVPKPILGILDDVNLASAQAVEYIFSKYKIKPRMGFFVQGLNKYYLPMWKLDSQKFRLNYTDPVPQNVEQQIQIINSGRTNNWMTANEARAMFSYPPREGGDELELSAMETDIPGSDQPDDPAHTEQDDEEDIGVNEGDKSVKKKTIKGKPIERSEESKQKEQDYKQEQIALLHKTYLKLNTKLQNELVKRAKKYKAAKVEIPKDEPYIKKLERLLVKDTVGQSDELVNWIFENDMFSGWVTAVYNASEDGLKQTVGEAGRATFADLNMEGSFDLKNPRAEAWIKDNALQDTESYSDTIKQSITDKLVEGVNQGFSNEKIADSISQYFTDNSDYQALRMARYETITGYGAGNLEGFKQSGVVSKKFWIADGKACTTCKVNADAGPIGLDEEFPSGDQHPENHPNGECSLGGTTDMEA